MHILAPLSLLYRAVTDIRNWMFDHGWLEERRYDIPVVCIGNLAVGGTGKTPHCEWLVGHLLEEGRRVAILSRGYGRKTRGFVEATAESRADEVGDEPLQLFWHFATKEQTQTAKGKGNRSRVIVAVCEERRRGIERLLERHPDLDVIVLDDAFQHRYVRPSHRLLLTDYSRLYTTDHLMPWGRLRESRKGAARADVIIVTKCPANLSTEERKRIVETLHPEPHQQVFFSTMTYAPIPELEAVDPEVEGAPRACIALLAGIAYPEPFKAHFEGKKESAETIKMKEDQQVANVCATLFFADHHNFTASDVARIEAMAREVDYIITTAKDHARLQSLALNQATRQKILVQHISVSILGDEKALLQLI